MLSWGSMSIQSLDAIGVNTRDDLHGEDTLIAVMNELCLKLITSLRVDVEQISVSISPEKISRSYSKRLSFSEF